MEGWGEVIEFGSLDKALQGWVAEFKLLEVEVREGDRFEDVMGEVRGWFRLGDVEEVVRKKAGWSVNDCGVWTRPGEKSVAAPVGAVSAEVKGADGEFDVADKAPATEVSEEVKLQLENRDGLVAALETLEVSKSGKEEAAREEERTPGVFSMFGGPKMEGAKESAEADGPRPVLPCKSRPGR